MAGHSRPKDGVASLANVPAIPLRDAGAFLNEIAGTSPAMTSFSMWPVSATATPPS